MHSSLSTKLSLPLVLLIALLLPASGIAEGTDRAVASCQFDADSGKVRIDGSDVSVLRRGTELVFKEAGTGALACTGGKPTVRNVEQVRILMLEGTIYESVQLDLRGGRLQGGAGIRFDLVFTNANNSDEGAAVEVLGSEADDRIAIGHVGRKAALALATAPGKPGGFPDVIIHAKLGLDLAVNGGQGDDTIDAFGATDETGDGPIAGRAAELRLLGRGGADVIHGSDEADLIVGDEGHDVLDGHGGDDRIKGGSHSDRMLGGPGDDELQARDGLEDRLVDCGEGTKDEAKVDALDDGHVSGCESVRVGVGAGLASA